VAVVTRFQQRHYEAIAEVMQEAKRDASCEAELDGIARVEAELVALFRGDNCHFMPERFRAACVPGANVRARTRYEVRP
jgi:hypothetical protein